MLVEVKQLLSVHSQLRARVMDELHRARIEIVSPAFMNTRSLDEDRRVLPETAPASVSTPVSASSPESIVFDKAAAAESVEANLQKLETRLEHADGEERTRIEAEIAALQGARDPLTGETTPDPE